nr:transporter substrate-binding domain-containing protein [Enterococcus timonensis]
MKKIFWPLLLGLLLFTFAGCSSETSTTSVITPDSIRERGVLRVGVKLDVPNFGFEDPDTGQMEGMEVDLGRKLAEKITGSEKNVEFVGVTAKTRGPLLDNGEVDLVIATFTITEDRRKSFHFTPPYYTDEVGFLVRKEDGFTDLASLDKQVIGVAQSATTKQSIEAQGEPDNLTFEFLEFGPYPMLKLALTSKRIAAFSGDKSILTGYVDDETEILDIGFAPQQYGVTSSLGNTELAEVLDNAVNEFIQDGTMEELLSKWNIQNVTEEDD